MRLLAFSAAALLSFAAAGGDAASDMKMVLIKGGTFEMGSASGEKDQAPSRKVKIDDFYMDAKEVSQASYSSLIGVNPSKFLNTKNPVERTKWSDAARYCNARSLKEGLKPCYDEKTWVCDFSANGYRLPTEAEWEYASKAGSPGEFYFKEGKAGLEKNAWIPRRKIQAARRMSAA